MFRPRGKGGTPLHRKKADQSAKKVKFQKAWDARKDFILKFLRDKGPVTSKELRAGIKRMVPPGVRQRTMAMLLADNKVKREGWSKGTRWSAV